MINTIFLGILLEFFHGFGDINDLIPLGIVDPSFDGSLQPTLAEFVLEHYVRKCLSDRMLNYFVGMSMASCHPSRCMRPI